MLLRELKEGFTLHQGAGPEGKDVIDYSPDREDDEQFKDVAKSKGFQKKELPTLKDLRTSTAEIEELTPYIERNRKGYQDYIDAYTAMPVYKEAYKTGKLRDFMDALKGKESNAVFSERGKQALLHDGAKSIVRQLLSDRPLKLMRNVIISPVPSSSALVKEFTKEMATLLNQAPNGKGKVNVKMDLFQKTAIPKYGAIRRSHHAGEEIKRHTTKEREVYSFPFKSRKLSFDKENLDNLIKDYVNAWSQDIITDEQIEKEISALKIKVQEKINSLIDEFQQAKPNEKQKIGEYLQEYKNKLEYLNKNFWNDLEKRQELLTSPEYKQAHRSAGEIKALHGKTREMSYDRFQVNQTEPFPPGTLLLLIDDNVDTGKSIVDIYRSMFKKGIVDRKNVLVVAAALQLMKG